MSEIVIVEDDFELGQLINSFIVNEGYSTVLYSNGEQAIKYIEKNAPDLLLLDVMLPDMNGFEVCQAVRKIKDIPILMMSAMTDEESKLTGYENGADDYIDKPFSVNILIAKIKALLKRSGREGSEILSALGITLNLTSRTAYKNGEQLKLNVKEFDLLYILMKNRGKAMTKQQLFNEVWGTDCFSEFSTVSVHIRWLREKLEDNPKQPALIKTVYKIGYTFGE